MGNITKTTAYKVSRNLKDSDINKIKYVKSIANEYLLDICQSNIAEYIEFADGSCLGVLDSDDYVLSTHKEYISWLAKNIKECVA